MTEHEPDAPPGIEVEVMRRRLLAARDTLLGVSTMSSGSRGTVELDQASVGRLSRMDAMQLQAMAMATERRRVAALARIEAALLRIEAKEYGWCQQCGEPIAPGRLTLDPAVPTCVACAAGQTRPGD